MSSQRVKRGVLSLSRIHPRADIIWAAMGALIEHQLSLTVNGTEVDPLHLILPFWFLRSQFSRLPFPFPFPSSVSVSSLPSSHGVPSWILWRSRSLDTK